MTRWKKGGKVRKGKAFGRVRLSLKMFKSLGEMGIELLS